MPGRHVIGTSFILGTRLRASGPVAQTLSDVVESFFKDRTWLRLEFPELIACSEVDVSRPPRSLSFR